MKVSIRHVRLDKVYNLGNLETMKICVVVIEIHSLRPKRDMKSQRETCL